VPRRLSESFIFSYLPLICHPLRAIEGCLDRPIVGFQHCLVDKSQLLQYLKRASMNDDSAPKNNVLNQTPYLCDMIHILFLAVNRAVPAVSHPSNNFGKSTAGPLGSHNIYKLSEVQVCLNKASHRHVLLQTVHDSLHDSLSFSISYSKRSTARIFSAPWTK
jgi:hypothetical protein